MAPATPTADRSFPSWALPGGRSTAASAAVSPTGVAAPPALPAATPADGAGAPIGLPSRRVAYAIAVLGVVGGLLFLVAAVALPAAVVTIDRIGVALGAVERRQLDLALALSPSVAIVGLVHLVAAWSLAVGRRSSRTLGTAVAGAGVALALAGIAGIAVGRDPFAGTGTGSAADGIGILAATGLLYASVVGALAFGRPSGTPDGAHASVAAA